MRPSHVPEAGGQLSLFDATRKRKPPVMPAHQATESSREAAESIRAHAESARERVYRYLAGRGSAGATRYETAADLDMPVETAGPRLHELERAGRIVFVGWHRPSLRGRKCRVYVVTHTTGRRA